MADAAVVRLLERVRKTQRYVQRFPAARIVQEMKMPRRHRFTAELPGYIAFMRELETAALQDS